MQRRLLVPCLALASFPALSAQDSPRDAWQQFVRDNGSSWTVEWNAATGTPSAIFGRGLDLPGRADTLAEAQRRADATLAKYSALLGRGDSRFVVRLSGKMGRAWAFVYKQQFKSLDVISARADVRVHETGGISMFGSRAFQIPATFNLVPAITKEAARTAAYEERNETPPVAPMAAAGARLVIWGDANAAARVAPRLAWEIDVNVSATVTGKSYVDAALGTVLQFVSGYHECAFGCNAHAKGKSHAHGSFRVKATNGRPRPGPVGAAPVVGKVQAWANTGLKPTDPMRLIPMENIRVQVIGGNTGFTDTSGNFSIPHAGTTPVQVNVQFVGRHVRTVNPSQGTRMNTQVTATPNTPVTITIYNANSGQHDRAQSTSYWGTDDIHQWLTGLNGTLPSRINDLTVNTSLTRTCNAFFTSGGFSINFFSAGGGCNMTAYSTVIYHEWGHAIDFVYGGISQTDGLSEGWGDMIAILRTNQPVVGDAFRTNGGAIRTALNTRTYPAGGGVHQQGQTWMGFGWDLRENLRRRKGAAGIAIANKIIMNTLVADATNQPNAVREVFIADDDDNNLDNGTPNYDDLEAAATKRRLPFPQKKFADAGSYTSYGAGCRGTGSVPAVCVQANISGNLRGSSGFAGIRYMLEIDAPRALDIEGFEIKQASRRAGSVTIPTFLYNADAQGRPGSVLATGTMSVGSSAAFYKTTLNTRVQIASGQKFFIGFQNANPTITVGTQNPGQRVRYWRNNGTNGSWVSFNTLAWGYKVNCKASSGAVPMLAHTGNPVVSIDLNLNLSRAKASAPAVLFLGGSDQQFGALRLPFDLTGLGAGGCSLLASGELLLGTVANGVGDASITLSIPNDLNLHRAKFFNQYMVIDAGANTLGLAFTNGGAAVIGKP